MYNESQLKVASLILKDKVFKYEKTKGTFEGFTFYFTAKVTGQRIMYSMGEPHPVIQVDVKIVKIEGLGAGVFKTANHLRKTFNRVEMLSTYSFNNGMDYIMGYIGSELVQTFKVLDSNVSVQVENMTIPDDVEILDYFDLYKKKITESKVQKSTIRTVIKDIITILKTKEEGEFYLPYEISEEDFYEFDDFPEFSVDLDIRYVGFEDIPSGADYKISSNFVQEQDRIDILILINPERLEKSLYSIIGKLNDDITHELQHLRQEEEDRLSTEDFYRSNKEYFLQPHEIEAQYYGYKRQSEVTGLSMEELIDDYFEHNADDYDLDQSDVEEIKRTILSYR